MYNAIGMVEFTSISRGIYAADQMMKAADVDAISSVSVCPGKYIVIISGDVGAVESSVNVGIETAGEFYVDSLMLANVHPDVFPAITATTMPEKVKAVGIIETFSLSCIIGVADACLKVAAVEAIEIRMGTGLGGKAYFSFTGELSAVDSAVATGKQVAIDHGLLINAEIIPSLTKELMQALF